MAQAAMRPTAPDGLREIGRALSSLIGRERVRELMEGVATRAGVDLTPASCWLLAQYHFHPHLDLPERALSASVPLPRAQTALAELTQKGMLHADLSLTDLGEASLARLAVERRELLNRLLEGWQPEQHQDLAEFLHRLSDELATSPGRELTTAQSEPAPVRA
jgi:hypothetical protein